VRGVPHDFACAQILALIASENIQVLQLTPTRLKLLLEGSDLSALTRIRTLLVGGEALPRHLAEWISSLGLSQFWLLMALMVFFVILGCFLDGISMVVLTMGVILPTVTKAGIDLIWFGIFVVLVVEMAQITPPVGFNLFVLQGMTKKQITWIAKHTLPMFYLMIVAVLLTYFFPALVTWLPQQMMSK